MNRPTRTNWRRGGKLAASIFAVAAMCAFCASGYVTSDWNPNGYGNWSEATRWKSGTPLPTEQDRSVKIINADAFATDADYDILKDLVRVRFDGTATLDLRFNEDHTDFSLNSVQNMSDRSHGTMIKSGTGLLVDSTIDTKFDIDDYVVTNGTLKIAANPSGVKFGVHSPGVLVFAQASSIGGLEGDGIVSNTVSKMQLYFTGGTRENPVVFDGTLGLCLNPSFNAGCQHFTTMNSPYGRDVRIYDGFVGLKNFGTTGESGSLGTAENFWFQGTGGMVYIGDGETTDKKFNIGLNCKSATLDAGAKGGVTFSGNLAGKECPRLYLLNLEGSNTVRCVFTGEVTGNTTNGAMVVKRGSGTWQFSDRTRDYIATVTVEDGTLEYGSMAEAGTTCSLGKSVRRYADTFGLMKNLTLEPWAFRLGTHSTTGTFAYVGSADVACTSRLFTVRGTGIVRSDTAAALSYTGATSYDAQGGTLILEGSGGYDNFANVTNGVGPLAVEKRGIGTWTLARNIDLAGVTVKDGTLRISNSRQYRWYRYTVKRIWSDSETALQIAQFGLFSASGVQQNVGLTENTEATGKTYLLNGGECGWNHVRTYNSGRSITSLFKGDDQNGLMTAYRYNYSAKAPKVSDPSTWLSFTMRVADNADTVKFYDVKSYSGNQNSVMYMREPRVWIFEGSVDGRNWDFLDGQEDLTVPGADKYWYSTGSKTFNASSPGFEVATEAPECTVNLGFVSVQGGTLVADVPVTVSNLVVDVECGGTLDGFAFAPNGTLTVQNLPDGNVVTELPGTYVNCTGLDGVSQWTLRDGDALSRKRISVSGGVIRIVPPGTAIVFR